MYESATKTNICGENIYFPIEIDTEYVHPSYELNNPSTDLCKNLTLQCRAIGSEIQKIYIHPDSSTIARHKVFEGGFVAVDYLNDLGYQTRLTRHSSGQSANDLPWMQIDVYSFFAVAELLRMFQGEFQKDIIELVAQKRNWGIDQGRRVRTFTNTEKGLVNYVELPWIITINNYSHLVRLCIYDTCAVHGNANYKSFCTNSGIDLKYKDNFSNIEKRMMDAMYQQRPDDFDNYALGDLYNHDALLGNAENFRKIYDALDLSNYYSMPKLTIGATVAKLFEASIKKQFSNVIERHKLFKHNQNGIVNKFCRYGSADYLKRLTTTTGCLNAKVDGGRCRNNRPTDTVARGVLCDIDISGCYGEGLRVQTYPLGIPTCIEYLVKESKNKYQTLRQFLRKYRKQLVPGLWQARVSLIDGYLLKYKQDYLASWFPPKDMSKMVTDSDLVETDQWWEVDNVGEIKILTNEVQHAIITHDFIQWLENIASARQRKELLDNLYVETCLYYPASDRVESPAALVDAHLNHSGWNTCEVKDENGLTTVIKKEQECGKWYGINLGELLITQLLKERKKHPKKTPFNELYKLCINTVYGDMVSPYFKVGNVVVGNNITARARALAWCMEKGLHGWQSITDGCVFDTNRVLYPRDKDDRINGEMVVDLHEEKTYKYHTFQPLSYVDEIPKTDIYQPIEIKQADNGIMILLPTDRGQLSLPESEAMDWVNRTAMIHLQNTFPNLDVLHQVTTDVYGRERVGQFEFEAKGFFDTATFHGSANYSLTINGNKKYAMRSYSKKEHRAYTLENDQLQLISNEFKPSETFLNQLHSPHSINRSHIFIRERILKIGDYRRNYRVWKDTKAYPGCTTEIAALMHEFSLSQFTFRNKKQLDAWRSEHVKLCKKYNQSFEMYFMNSDGTLNYQKMVLTVNRAIVDGKQSLLEGIDKRKLNAYRLMEKHREAPCFDKVRDKLSERYHGLIEQCFPKPEDYEIDW